MAEHSAQLSLQSKTALVTGDLRGIDDSIAYVLASRGVDVILTHTSATSKRLVAEFESKIQPLPHAPKAFSISIDFKEQMGPNQVVSQELAWSE